MRSKREVSMRAVGRGRVWVAALAGALVVSVALNGVLLVEQRDQARRTARALAAAGVHAETYLTLAHGQARMILDARSRRDPERLIDQLTAANAQLELGASLGHPQDEAWASLSRRVLDERNALIRMVQDGLRDRPPTDEERRRLEAMQSVLLEVTRALEGVAGPGAAVRASAETSESSFGRSER